MTDSSLLAWVEEYLAFRRGLGFDLGSAACHLRSFARYAEQTGHSGPITVDLATRWALRSRSREPAQAARRLAMIRLFARHRALIDPATEIPPPDLLGRAPRRRQPHIYSDAEIRALLQQASRMRPRGGLCPKTYVAFFALLLSTGLRLSEACRLTCGDVDLHGGLLTVRETKFRKSRCVPLHPSTTRALTQCARTRNLRLTAIRSFMRYVSVRDPASLPVAQRVLAIAGKRFDRPVLEFLSRDEIQALLDAPDLATWSGQRDAALFAVLYNTGARVSEIIRLRVADVLLDRAHAVHLHGKGRKERVIPLWKITVAQLRAWFERIDRRPEAPVFPNRAGNPMSRSGVEHRLRVTIGKASVQCPSLRSRPISPHTVRHSTAMHLLQSGVDITIIAMWLGHEDTATTHQYIEADLAMKEAALKRLDAPSSKPVRFKAKDRLLAFLEAL